MCTAREPGCSTAQHAQPSAPALPPEPGPHARPRTLRTVAVRLVHAGGVVAADRVLGALDLAAALAVGAAGAGRGGRGGTHVASLSVQTCWRLGSVAAWFAHQQTGSLAQAGMLVGGGRPTGAAWGGSRGRGAGPVAAGAGVGQGRVGRAGAGVVLWLVVAGATAVDGAAALLAGATGVLEPAQAIVLRVAAGKVVKLARAGDARRIAHGAGGLAVHHASAHRALCALKHDVAQAELSAAGAHKGRCRG